MRHHLNAILQDAIRHDVATSFPAARLAARVAAIFTLSCALTPAPLFAQATTPKDASPTDHHEEWQTRPITFDEAIGFAERNSVVRGTEAALAAREAGDRDLGDLQQNPSFYIAPGYRFTPDEQKGFELQGALYQSWNVTGYGTARRAAASAERDELAVAARAEAIEQRINAASAWLQRYAAEQSIAVAHHELETALALHDTINRAFEGGVATSADLATAAATIAEARMRLTDLEGESYHAANTLAQVLGLASGTMPTTSGAAPSPTLPADADWPRLYARARDLPVVSRARLAATAARAREVELARSATGSFDTGLLFQRESPNSVLALISLGATLPLFETQQRARSDAAAQVAQLNHVSEKAELDAAHELHFALHEVEHLRKSANLIYQQLLPALEGALTAVERANAAGEVDTITLLDTRLNLLAARRLAIAADAARRWAEIRAFLLIAALGTTPSNDTPSATSSKGTSP